MYEELIPKLIEFAENKEKPSRFKHTQGVVEMSQELAERYGADKEKLLVAAWFHDTFKEAGNLQHGAVAADMLQKLYGVEDEEILNAVRYHTTGHPGMTLMEKILKISDALEPGRDFPGVDRLRDAIGDNINLSLLTLMKETKLYVEHIGGTFAEISVRTIAWLEELLESEKQSE